MTGQKTNTTIAPQGASAHNQVASAGKSVILTKPGPSANGASASPSSAASQVHPPTQPQPQTHPRPKQPQPAPAPAQQQQQHHHHHNNHTRKNSTPKLLQQNGTKSKDHDPGSPPVSPITPPLVPLKSTTPIPPPTIPPNFASLGGRVPPLTHISHPATVPTAPPPLPEPIDFRDNVDVIAVQTAMAILQGQKRRAAEDIVKLRDIKAAAMEQPMEFVGDLVAGRVTQGDVGSGGVTVQDVDEDGGGDGDDDDDEAVKDEGSDAEFGTHNGSPGKGKGKATASTGMKGNGARGSSSNYVASPSPQPPWANLPRQQSVYRCPPINWSQYAVAGEALDRMHNEQMTRPTLGTPAVIRPDGTYEFTGAVNPDDGKKVVSISAPYDPFKDKLDQKTKGSSGSRRGT